MKVITYSQPYLGYEFNLCAVCRAEDNHEHGVVGPVLRGEHEGACDGARHEGEGRSAMADWAKKRAQQA